MAKKIIKLGLCKGRHEIPEISNYIFEMEVNPLDIEGLESQALEIIMKYFPYYLHEGKLELYVTGLTVALISVLNVCKKNGIEVTLFHFNRESGNYYQQQVY